MNMKKLCLISFLFTMLVSMPMSAYDFIKDGIYYNIEGDHVYVTYKQGVVYSGSVSIPSQVTYGGVTYPVTAIGKDAFDGCINMTSVSIPSSITSIGENAFIDCGSNVDVHISDLKSWCKIKFSSYQSCPLSSSKNLYVGGSVVTSLDIPYGVEAIPNFAFFRCRSIKSLSIPSTVKTIGSSAFKSCTSLELLCLSEGSLQSIGSSAFEGCTNLNTIVTEITNPFAFDENVFSTYSTALLMVKKGVTPIYKSTDGWKIFSNIIEEGDGGIVGQIVRVDNVNYKIGQNNTMSVTKSVKNPDIESLGDVVIHSTIPYNGVTYTVTSIEGAAFDIGHESYGISSIKIPSTIEKIGIEAFMDQVGIKAVYITDLAAWCNISFLGTPKYSNPLSKAGHLHLNETEIKDMIIPSGVTSIKAGTFYGCSGLTSVSIPSSVTSIGKSAFYGCSGLTKIVSEIKNPNSIADDVFYSSDKDIYATATLIVPEGEKANYQATDGWKIFSNIIEEGDGGIVGQIVRVDNVNYKIGQNNTMSVTKSVKNPDIESLGDVVIHSTIPYNGVTYTVTSIEGAAFDIGHESYGISSIKIPSTIEKIGIEAFMDQVGIKAVYITDLAAWCNISFLGTPKYSNPLSKAGHLYLNETEIKDMIIPNGVTLIKAGTFYGCSGLTSVSIPSSVTSIGKSAFYGCSGLTKIVSEIKNPNSIADDVFYSSDKDIYATATLIVPEGEKANYQATDGWKNFSRIIEVGGIGYEFEIDGIKYRVNNNNNLSVISKTGKYSGAIIIPETVIFNGKTYIVTSIGTYAFSGCSDLTSITVPSTLNHIGEDAFKGCESLLAVYISDLDAWLNVKVALGYISGGIDYSSNPLYYAKYLFLNEEEINSIKIPNTWSSIPSFYFQNWNFLNSVVIPNNITSIPIYTFSGCTSLTSVIIGKNVSSILNSAFNNCSSLSSIISLNSNPPSITSSKVFNNVDKNNCVVWVPKGSLSAYNGANEWKDFANIKEIIVGDVNLDEKVNQDDLKALVNFIMGKNPLGFYESLADLDGDLKVNAADVVLLIKIIK